MLIGQHEAEVYRYIKYLGANHIVAEDVAQETFLAAYRSSNVPPVDDVPRRRAWLRAIARNQFLSHCRRERRNPVLASSEALDIAEQHWAARYSDDSGHAAAADALQACLDELPERSRRLLRLRYEENRSRAEMARAMDLQVEGIKTALRRLRVALAKCVQTRLRQGTR